MDIILKFRKSSRGAMFYTMIGVMVIALVMVVALHLMESTYRPGDADRMRYRDFGYEINSVKAEIPSLARDALYPAVWKAGHNVDPSGVNTYLTGTLDQGRERLKEDLTADFVDGLNERLLAWSEANSSDSYTINPSQDTPVTVSKLTPENIEVTESGEGMTFTIKIRMNASKDRYNYLEDAVITAEVPFRLFDMYERAWNFTDNYAENVQWATTIGLYLKAYLNAYDPSTDGSLLREGDIAYDPIEPVLSGDLTALKTFTADSITDIGTVPLATWLCEWKYLGEPSYLPTGTDLDFSMEGNSRIIDQTLKNYDVAEATDCESLPATEQQECREFNDPDNISAKADDLEQEYLHLKQIRDDIEDWTDTPNNEYTQKTCNDFKDEAREIIEEVVGEFSQEDAKQWVVDAGLDYAIGTELEDEVTENENTLLKITTIIDKLNNIKSKRLPAFSDSNCSLDELMDCECADGPQNCDGFFYCMECDDPSCNKIQCSSGSEDFSCSSIEDGSKRTEPVDCDVESCEESEGSLVCESWVEEKNVRIPQCDCQCHPDDNIIGDIKDELEDIMEIIDERMARLYDQESELRERERMLREAESKLAEIQELKDNSKPTRYDVWSKIRFSEVKYYPDTLPKTYYDPTWTERLNGTCGDAPLSTGFYTGQISAATVCCAMLQSCCPAIKYATQWFPAFYQVEATYNIDEKLIDDKNRVMLHNIFAGEDDLYGHDTDPKLYTHVSPEFIIYQDYPIQVKPKTLDRILVYLYLPKIAQTQTSKSAGLEKVLDSFTDPTCTGKP